MTHDEMIAVIQAHKEGKTLQANLPNLNGEWTDITEPSFDFYRLRYRVKPGPREWWIWPYPTVGVAERKPESREYIHVREVIEE